MLDYKEFRELVAKIVSDLNPYFELNSDCVKVWHTDKMLIQNVMIGCDQVKKLGFNVIVYNTVVPLKSEISKNTGINILDGNDLILLAIKYDELLKNESLIKYNY
ncbi:MAG: hypothetical protein PHE25_06375 [Candidatus Gracilibacteria bacterium]|nr:hypothetical protein [Candidatus Gracilibacteria bacterium]